VVSPDRTGLGLVPASNLNSAQDGREVLLRRVRVYLKTDDVRWQAVVEVPNVLVRLRVYRPPARPKNVPRISQRLIIRSIRGLT
jgi:hypothetical protein